MELKKLIPSVMMKKPSSLSVNEFIFVCRKIAVVQLKRKVQNGHLHVDFFKLSIEDLALDCIADLFQQDEDSTLIQIKAYFEGLPVETSDEEELLSHLRRLVFGKVNNGLFRIYNEHDPTLGKILRNIKLAIQALNNFVIADRYGENHIVPSMCDTLEHLPVYERTQLESLLRFGIKGKENIPTMLAFLAHHLREQEEYCRLVPLMDVAILIRSIYTSQGEKATYTNETEESQTLNDARAIIKQVCQQVEQEFAPKYINKKGIPQIVFLKFFEVIEQNLNQTIVTGDGQDFSYFEQLKSRLPELTKEEYHQKYKSQLEYLGRITHERAITTLRKNL